MGEEGAKLLERGPELSDDQRIDIKGIKYFADGALGSRGAALLEPYNDAEGKGLQLIDREKALPVYIEALKKGIQIENMPLVIMPIVLFWIYTRKHLTLFR